MCWSGLDGGQQAQKTPGETPVQTTGPWQGLQEVLTVIWEGSRLPPQTSVPSTVSSNQGHHMLKHVWFAG